MKFNQLKAGVVLSYLGQGINVIVQLAYMPVLLRLLGEQEYGLYSLVASVSSYLSLLSFGIGGAYLRFYFREKKENGEQGVARLNAMFLIAYMVVAGAALAIGCLLALRPESIFGSKLTTAELEQSGILLLMMSLNTAISLPNTVFTSYIMAHERYVMLRGCSIVVSVATPLLSLTMLLLGMGSVGLVCAALMIQFILSVCYIVYAYRVLEIRFLFRGMQWGVLKEVYLFSFFLFLNQIIDMINWHMDSLLLGRFWGTAEVAVYSLAGRINSIYMTFSTAISSVLAPRVNRIVRSGEDVNAQLNALMQRTGRIQYLVLMLFLLGFILLGRPFLVWMGGSESFQRSYPALLLLTIPATIPLVQNLGIEIQRAKNKHQFRSIVYSAMALINLAISIPLSKAYGTVGAAVGTAVSMTVGNGLIMNWYYHTHLDLNMISFWKGLSSLIPGTILPVLYCLVCMRNVPVHTGLTFFAVGTGLVLVYIVSMWLMGMNQDEKALLRKFFAPRAGKDGKNDQNQ